MKILLRQANLLDGGPLKDIYIENGIIRDIDLELTPDENVAVIEAQGRIVISGLVNAHAHLDKSLIISRQPYLDEPPPVRAGWVRDLKQQFTKDDIKARAREVVEKSIACGVIGIRTNVDVDPLVGLKGVQALLELKQEMVDKLDIQVVAFNQEGFNRFPQTKELLEESLKLGADSVGGHTSIDADGKKEHIDKIFELATRYQVDIDFHADETGRPDDHMLPYLFEKTKAEGYQGRVNAIHCCSLATISEEEVKRDLEGLQQARINVVVCPTAIATRKLTEIKRMLPLGLKLGIGTDNIQDPFNPLGNSNLWEIGQLLAYVKRFYEDSEMEALFGMLTDNDHAFVDVSRFAIRVGNPARICLLKASRPADIFRYNGIIERMLI